MRNMKFSLNESTIGNILQKDFVKTDEVAQIISLAFTSEKNAIIFGPGGHGKSEMVKSIISGLGLEEEVFSQFFGEGMDEARLFGGLNFRKLEEEKILEYYPERSFLNYRVAVFEELFDAPPSVLMALKDVLTAKELRNGAQRFPMKTQVIICLTNKDPKEIADLGPSAQALTERFPLLLDLKWESYEPSDYQELLTLVLEKKNWQGDKSFLLVLSDILAGATAAGNFVSPRTAVHAMEIVMASAELRRSNIVGQQDMTNLRFVPGLESLAETIVDDLKKAYERSAAETHLSSIDLKVAYIIQRGAASPIEALKMVKKLTGVLDEVGNLRVPDSLTQKRESLQSGITREINKFRALAEDLIRL